MAADLAGAGFVNGAARVLGWHVVLVVSSCHPWGKGEGAGGEMLDEGRERRAGPRVMAVKRGGRGREVSFLPALPALSVCTVCLRCLSALSVCTVCLSVCLHCLHCSACLSVCLSVCVYLPTLSLSTPEETRATPKRAVRVG